MAGRKGSTANKVPCATGGLCGGSTRNHIVGTYTQQKCAEIASRIANGETITPEAAMSIKPPGMQSFADKADPVRDEMSRLRALADAWKDDPQAALDFVRWANNFTNYSPLNRIMIRLQAPDATQVAAKRKWESMGREVSEDAPEIQIFAPGYQPERVKKDANGNVVRDEKGEPVKEKVFVNRFRAVHVYDIASTTGDTEPEIPTAVHNSEGLQGLVTELETSYMLYPSDVPMAADVPARINSDGKVVFNTSTADESQQLVNRLVATGMAISMHLREDKERRLAQDSERRFTSDEHLYAGVAAAWAIAKDAGVDMTDLAIDKMSRYAGKQDASTLASHASSVSEHIDLIRQGMPLSIADALV